MAAGDDSTEAEGATVLVVQHGCDAPSSAACKDLGGSELYACADAAKEQQAGDHGTRLLDCGHIAREGGGRGALGDSGFGPTGE